MQSYRSATLPNRRYGGRVAQKKAIFESLASDSLSSSVSTSSIEFSAPPSSKKFSSFKATKDFSDRKTPFSYTPAGYKTMIDRYTQTDADLGMENVNYNVFCVSVQILKNYLGWKIISGFEEEIIGTTFFNRGW